VRTRRSRRRIAPPPPRLREPSRRALRCRLARLPEEEVRARVAGYQQRLAAPADEFDPTPPGLFAGDPPGEFWPLLEAMTADVRPESMRTALRAMAEADQRDLLPHIAVPTLLLWGELDARSPLSVARQVEQAILDTKLAVIPGAGHMSNLEQPEPFNDAVREFCGAHAPRSARAGCSPAP
jgi:pimeloyl-ACP methyl ester carboxylesterase